MRNWPNIEKPIEAKILAEISAFRKSKQRMMSFDRSSYSWLCLEKQNSSRFYVYTYSPLKVKRSVQPLSLQHVERLLVSYVSRKRKWSNSVLFVSVDKSYSFPEAEDNDSEKWPSVAIAALILELVYTPVRLRQVAIGAIVGVALLTVGLGVGIIESILIVLVPYIALAAYIVNVFKSTKIALDRILNEDT